MRKIRFIWLILIVLLISFLAYQFVAPSGSWTCRHSFISSSLLSVTNSSGASSCVGLASPTERALQVAGGPLLILGEPVYFSVFSPRPFSNIQVDITYRPHFSSSTPIFEAGFLADKQLWRYRLQPVYNLWLEQGVLDWEELRSGNLHLFQRTHRFDSVSEFLTAWHNQGASFCATPRCLAIYNLSLEDAPPALDFNLLFKEPLKTLFPYELRGAHQFYIFVPEGGLELSGTLIDLNENKDIDPAEFVIFSGQRRLDSLVLPDNRSQTEESYESSKAQPFTIVRSDLAPGLYRLEFRASDDLVLSDLTINSAYLSIINKIWTLGDEAISLVTDAPYLQIKALSPVALQTLNFGGEELSLQEIYYQYEVNSNKSGELGINMPIGGLILANNGMFAATASSLFNPDYPRLDRFASLTGQLDFILADYTPATLQDDAWLTSRLSFSTADLYREQNHYSLILSVPGLKLDGGQGGFLEVKDISIKFYGASLMDKLKDWFNL